MDTTRLCKLIDERSGELYDLLAQLVRINSESFGSHGNEEACARWIAEACRALGLETELYSPLSLEGFEAHPEYMPGRNLQNRPNVTARWPGAAPGDGMMLMGHIDTVPIGDRAAWTVDPLGGELRDGRVWGRGTNDDKCALAACLFLIRLLREEGVRLREGLLFTAYSDEEFGGSHGALAAVLKYPARRIVNLDCRSGELWHCASGGQRVRFRFHAAGIVDTARETTRALPIVVDVIECFGERRRSELARNPYYRNTEVPAHALRYMSARAGGLSYDMGVGEVVFAFYTDRTKAQIEEEYAALESELREALEPLGFVSEGLTPETRFFHYAFRDPRGEEIQAMERCALSATGRPLRVCGSCLSDLSILMKYGGESVFSFAFGRDFSDPGGAHQVDEYIECSQLLDDTKTLGAYILDRLAEP